MESLRHRRPQVGLSLACVTGGLLAVWMLFAVFAARPAHAILVNEGGQEFGVQQRALLPQPPYPREVKPLQYHGGAVAPASYTYAIYWDPKGAYRPDWMSLIDGYFHNVGVDSGKLSNLFSLTGQYTGPAGTRAAYDSTFRGAYTDATQYPSSECTATAQLPVCLTDKQIHAELQAFVEANHLPTGADDLYFLLTPPGVRVCTVPSNEGACSNSTTTEGETEVEATNGICGYHSFIEPQPSVQIVYAVQPWIAGDTGKILKSIPVETVEPKPEALACQNGEALVEPHQETTYYNQFDNYETGLADVIISDLSVEQANMVVDPLLNGWYQTATSYEQSDMCQRAFGTPGEELPKVPATTHALSLSDEHINGVSYYLQWAFSSVGATKGEGKQCWEATELIPHFTSPNPVNVGDIVGFDANESKVALVADMTALGAEEPFSAPVYTWSFGDGSSVVSGPGYGYASVFHSYAKPGSYTVTLVVTDSAGNQATSTGTVDVMGTEAGPVGAPTAGSPGPSAPSGGTSVAPPTAPHVYEKVASYSLKKVLRYGLAVSYYANEQLAGGAQVMIDKRLAKRLHIKGPLATGLPKGYPSQVIIGGQVLITTTAGNGMLRFKLSKQIVKRLSHVHKLKVTLRIVVRNADRAHPQTATLLSTVVLK